MKEQKIDLFEKAMIGEMANIVINHKSLQEEYKLFKQSFIDYIGHAPGMRQNEKYEELVKQNG